MNGINSRNVVKVREHASFRCRLPNLCIYDPEKIIRRKSYILCLRLYTIAPKEPPPTRQSGVGNHRIVYVLTSAE